MSIAIMSEMFAIPFGNATRKMVAIRLADFADDQGRGIWPSVDTLAEQCELSARTVQRVLGEFVDEGLLVKRQQGGGRKTSRYDFDLAKVRARKVQNVPADPVVETAAETGDEASKNLPNDEGCHPVTGDTDDVRGDTVSPLGCHSVGGTVNEPSITTNEREGAGARPVGDDEKESQTGEAFVVDDQLAAPQGGCDGVDDGTAGADAGAMAADAPGKAAFSKRITRLITGEGYSAGLWPGAANSSFDYIARHFAALEPDVRATAERWRDAYLRDCAQTKVKPKPLGLYLKDRTWTLLDPALLAKADKAAVAAVPVDKRPDPDGWANAWGPVFNALVIKTLLADRMDGATHVPMLRAEIERAWPKLAGLRAQAARHRGAKMGAALHDLKPLMEAVPLDCAVAGEWRDRFDALGWPWLAEFDRRDVVYLPKDLAAFCTALGVAMSSAGDTPNQERHAASEPMRGSLPPAGDTLKNGETP